MRKRQRSIKRYRLIQEIYFSTPARKSLDFLTSRKCVSLFEAPFCSTFRDISLYQYTFYCIISVFTAYYMLSFSLLYSEFSSSSLSFIRMFACFTPRSIVGESLIGFHWSEFAYSFDLACPTCGIVDKCDNNSVRGATCRS